MGESGSAQLVSLSTQTISANPPSSPNDGVSPLPLKLAVTNVSYFDATQAEPGFSSDNHCWPDTGGVGSY